MVELSVIVPVYGCADCLEALHRRLSPVLQACLRLGVAARHALFTFPGLGLGAPAIKYAPAPRHSGQSSYSLRTLVGHAFQGLVFQTTTLLRWIVYFGFIVSAAGALLAAYLVFVYFAGTPPPGWTSLAVLILLIGGFVIMSTGVTGLYIGRIFEQVKDRPLYVIDKRVNGERK